MATAVHHRGLSTLQQESKTLPLTTSLCSELSYTPFGKSIQTCVGHKPSVRCFHFSMQHKPDSHKLNCKHTLISSVWVGGCKHHAGSPSNFEGVRTCNHRRKCIGTELGT
eukprot:4476362-Amphidinium_carterae.1